uniref:Uncharacterized protein n=1 Tax=Timema poppense TaxID=170557 RepID=A0A7R9D6C0_TIMPO|nr:unnamed protein product [Timema poppensis]
MKLEFGVSAATFAMSPNLPVSGSPVFYESDALDHAITEAEDTPGALRAPETTDKRDNFSRGMREMMTTKEARKILSKLFYNGQNRGDTKPLSTKVAWYGFSRHLVCERDSGLGYIPGPFHSRNQRDNSQLLEVPLMLKRLFKWGTFSLQAIHTQDLQYDSEVPNMWKAGAF